MDITPDYPLTPSSKIPGGAAPSDVSSGSIASSGTMIQPSSGEMASNLGPMQVGANSLAIGSGNDIFKMDNQGIWLGAATFAAAPFSVDMQGNVIALSGIFKGALSAASIDIPDTTTANSFHVDTDGNAWWGATTLAGAVAKVTKAGAATFTSGAIGGWTIGATTLVGGNITLDQANNKITVGATNGIVINGSDSTITSNDGTTWKLDGSGTVTGIVNYVNGTTTKNAADASTTQNIAHGLGRIPKYVRLHCIETAASFASSYGYAQTIYNGTTQSSQSFYNTASGTVSDNTFSLNINGSAAYTRGVITVDATNISIAWTKTNLPTGIYQILWEAEG